MRTLVVSLLLLVACGSDDNSSADGAGTGGAGTGGGAGVNAGGSGATGGAVSAGGALASGGSGALAGSSNGGSTSTGAAAGAGGSGGSAAGSAGSAGASGASGVATWVAVGNWGFRVTTSDGVSLDTTANPAQGNDHTPDLLRDVSWGNGVFIAVGGDQNSMVMRSTNGATWTEDHAPGGTQWKGGVAYGGGLWVAVGGVGTVITSDDDGQSWSTEEVRLPSAGRDVAHGGGLFVAVGDSGMIASSTDGDSWSDHSRPGAGRFSGVAYGPGFFVATGADWNGSGFDVYCATSSDGTNWSDCGLDAGRFDTPVAVGDRLVVPTDTGYASSDNGTSWTTHATSIPPHLASSGDLIVGMFDDRVMSGASLDSLTQTATAERGPRALTLGWVQ